MTFLVFMYCFRENDLQLVNNSHFVVVLVAFLIILLSAFLSPSAASHTRHKPEIIRLVCNEILN